MKPDIRKPVLLLDAERCKRNIRRMSDKARKDNVIFRPHFKTHQSAEIGEWFREEGVECITVSSLSMAKYFADSGWKDIALAVAVNVLEIDSINELASRIKLNLLVESADAVAKLSKGLVHEVGIFVELDTGQHRTGVDGDDTRGILDLAWLVSIQPLMKFKGLLTHSGNAYQAAVPTQIAMIATGVASKLSLLKTVFQGDFPEIIVSVGDTPTCCIADNFQLVDEIRPGNFVFFDVMQFRLGVCNLEDIAVALAAPVISVHPERNEAVIYGGAIHFSKDHYVDADRKVVFGWVCNLANHGWSAPIPGLTLASLSQEHGIIRGSKEHISQLKIGDVLAILPVHSCLTANLMGRYLDLEGKEIEMFRYGK